MAHWTEETILITGATGFIGSHLTRALVAQGRDVAVLCRSSSDTARIADLLQRIRRINIDQDSSAFLSTSLRLAGVVHVATEYGRSSGNSIDTFKTNFILPTELLELAINAGARFFINTDSFFCKPQFNYQHLQAYTYSKTCFLGWAHKNADRIHVASLQLEHVYGPGDGANKFVPQLLAQMLDPGGQEIQLTDGRQKRDFVFVDDVVDAYCKVIEQGEKSAPGFSAYEVGTGRSVALRTFIESLQTATASKAVLNFGALPQRDGEIMDSTADLRNLSALGYQARFDLDTGIRKLVQAAQA
jgi:CDP-paratose synthetase